MGKTPQEDPDSGVAGDVLQILSDYLDVPVAELDPERPLEELGADSLDFIEIVFEIEEKFGVESKEEMPELRKRVRSIGDVIRLTSDLVAQKNA